jgi:hypothetical protein
VWYYLEGKASALPFIVAKGALDAPQLLSIHHTTKNHLQYLVMFGPFSALGLGLRIPFLEKAERTPKKGVNTEPLRNDGEGEHNWAKGESILKGNVHPIN